MKYINQKGETLLSVMMATAVAAGVLAMIVPAVLNLSKPNVVSESFNECRSIADNIIHKIKSNGTQARVFNPPINENSVYLNNRAWHNGAEVYNNQRIESEVGSSSETRWPHVKVIAWNQNRDTYDSNSPLLIQSSVNGLLSLYNSNRSYCRRTDGVDMSSVPDLQALLPDEMLNKNIKAHIKISPFNINSGNLSGCPRNLKIRPSAFVEPPPAVAANMIRFPGYTHNRGFEVSIKVDLESNNASSGSDSRVPANEKVASCVIKSRFQFDQAETLPPPPVATFTGNVYTFNKPAGVNTPGTHLVCKEEHFYYYYVTRRGFLGTRRRVRRQRPLVVNDWKICDKVTVCGETARRTELDQNAGQVALTFPPISTDCRSSMTVKLFDANGNTSDTIPLPRASTPTCVGICGVTIPPTRSERRPSSTTGYVVAGVQFDSRVAAERASTMTGGMPIEEITDPLQPQDTRMNSTHARVNNLNALADGAQALADNANALAGGAAGLPTGAVAGGVNAAANNAADAINAAAQAVAALTTMRNDLEIMDLSGNLIGNRLGIVGETALLEAEVAVARAQAAAAQAAIGSFGMNVEAASRAVASAQATVDAASAALSTCNSTTRRQCSGSRIDGTRECRDVPIDCSGPRSSLNSARATLSSAQSAMSAAQAAKSAAESSYRSNWDGV